MSIVTLRKGKYRVIWRDEHHRQHGHVIYGEKSKAQAWERDKRDQIARMKENLPVSSENDSKENEIQLYSQFLTSYCDRHKLERTYANSRHHLNSGARLIKVAGDRHMSEYSTEDLLRVRADILKKKLSPRTANRVISQIKTQFNHAIALKLLITNPAASILLRPLPEHESPRRALALEEIEKIVGYADKPYDQILTVLYSTGLRVGEAFRLKIEDIQGGNLVINRSKTFRSRMVPLPPVAISAIEALKGKRKSGPLITTHSKSNSFRSHLTIMLKIAYYRSTHDGKNPHSRTRRRIQKTVKTITSQDLRHSYISHLRSMGVDSELRGKLAGHSQKVDEKIYTHMGETVLKEAVEKAFSKNKKVDVMKEVMAACRAIVAGEKAKNISPEIVEVLKILENNLDQICPNE